MNQTLYSSPVMRAVQMIEQRTGIAAAVQFRADLDNLLYSLSQGDLPALIDKLDKSPESAPEWQQLIGAITVSETYFLRDKSHFHILKKNILPDLILKRRQDNQLTLNIWSVGCATGEEPYSLAITLFEMLPDLPRWKINIMGSDINNQSLIFARQGVYRPWAFRHTESSFRQQYFDPAPAGSQIKPQFRQMVQFRMFNVLSGAPLPQVDLIFSRNVLLYFSRAAIQRAEAAFYAALSPGGWLVLGPAESIRYDREQWVTHIFPGTPIYQKPAGWLMPGSVNYKSAPLEIEAEDAGLQNKLLPAASYTAAVEAVHADHFDEAERQLGMLLTAEPQHARAHTLLAFLLANRQARPEALAHLQTALSIDPLLADAHYVEAMMSLERGDTLGAKKSLESAIYSQRDHALAAFMLGNLYAQAGDLARAFRSWRNAYRAVDYFDDARFFSDLTDLTAGRFRALVGRHLDE